MHDRYRNLMKTVLLLLSFLMLIGCNTRGFIREGATYKDFYKDLKECEDENTPKWSFCTGIACRQQSGQISARRNQCMLARGWELSREDKAYRP